MEDRITRLAIEEVSDYLQVPLGMESVSFSLIDHFPLATIHFNGLWMGKHSENEAAGSTTSIDTLAQFDKLHISFLSEPLLENIFIVRAIEVEGGFLKYDVDSSGVSNIDFLIPKDTTTTVEQDTVIQPLDFTLDKLSFKELTCFYKDDQKKIQLKAFLGNIDARAKIDSVTMRVESEGNIKLTDCKFADTNLFKMQQTDLNYAIKYVPDSVALNKLDIQTEGAFLGVKGTIQLGDTTKTGMDLALTASDFNLKELVKYAPQQYLNDYQISQIDGILNLNASVKGAYAEKELPKVNGEFSLANGRIKYADYPEVENFYIKGSATNGYKQNNESTSILIDSLCIRSNEATLALKGSVANIDQPEYNFITQLNAKLEKWKPFIPDSLVQKLNGDITLDLKSNGVLPDSINSEFTDYVMEKSKASLLFHNLNIDLDSSLSLHKLSGKLKYAANKLWLDSFTIDIPQHDISLANNSLKANWVGSFNKTESLKIDLFVKNLETPGVLMNGKVSIKNLNRPTFVLQDTLQLDLPKLKKFIPDSIISDVKGNIYAIINSEGSLNPDSISEQIMDIIYDQSTFYAKMSDVWIDLPDTDMDIKKLSAQVHVDPKKVAIHHLEGTYHDISFHSDTTLIKNLFNTIVKDKPGKLEIEGIWRLDDLDYAMLDTYMGTEEEEGSTNKEAVVDKNGNVVKENAAPGWDMNYEVKGKVFAKSLKYNNALLDDISVKINIQPELYVIDQLKFNAFDGSMNSSLRIEIQEDNMEINIKNKVDRMDIKKLLHDMDNFDQKELIDENLSGIFSTDSFFIKMIMEEDSIIYPAMRIIGDITLENGGFYNYEPVSSLAPYIPGVKSLDTLVFNTIESHLFLMQDKMYVPKTEVHSNAFDISVIGMQSFGEDYEYRLEVHLHEILFGKGKKDKDRKPVFVKAFSLEGKDRNGFGKEEDQIKMANRIRSKERLLKLHFHPLTVSFNTGVK